MAEQPEECRKMKIKCQWFKKGKGGKRKCVRSETEILELEI